MLIADHLGGERKDALSADMAASATFSVSSSPAKHQRALEDSNTVLDLTVSLCGVAAKKVSLLCPLPSSLSPPLAVSDMSTEHMRLRYFSSSVVSALFNSIRSRLHTSSCE